MKENGSSAISMCTSRDEETHQVAVLLWTDPDVSIAPPAELAEFLHLGMRVLNIVLLGQASGIVHAHVAAEAKEDPRCLVG